MTAALAGLGTGALHALSGPDHLLGVAPHALACRRAAWRIGLAWGVGHGAGTAAVAAALIALASVLELAGVERWAERGAGAALIAVGLVALVAAPRRPARASGARRPQLHVPLAVGVVHGALGAAALVPVVLGASSPGLARALFLAGFWAGGAAAMAALTAWLATVARSPRLAAVLPRVPRAAGAASIAVGAAWLALA